MKLKIYAKVLVIIKSYNDAQGNLVFHKVMEGGWILYNKFYNDRGVLVETTEQWLPHKEPRIKFVVDLKEHAKETWHKFLHNFHAVWDTVHAFEE